MTDRYHLIGVAGVGMSALAELLLARGNTVSGSDRFWDQGRDLEVLRTLEKAGLQLRPQDGSGVQPGLTAVAVSSAIESDNPDLQEAHRRGIPVLHRAALLARLAQDRRCIAVAGTAGKTTVTGLLGWLLEQLGADPTVVNGGVVLNWAAPDRLGSVRKGQSDLWVLEVDESDRSLLEFQPAWALVTNVGRDHFEISEIVELFRRFSRRASEGVLCGEGLAEQLGPLHGGQPAIEAAPVATPDGDAGVFFYRGWRFFVPVPGRHNLANAALAVALCDRLGFDLDDIGVALKQFAGIRRRLERVGERHGVTVIDDYAHNPAKIRAAWEAMAASGRRVLGVWRPHGFSPLAALRTELAEAFSGIVRPEDRLYLLPVFYAGGTASRNIATEDLVHDLQQRKVPVEGVSDYAVLFQSLREEARPGDVILCMGARDPELPLFARRLVED